MQYMKARPSKEAYVKYSFFIALIVLALSACTPQTSIENNVIPQLISAKINIMAPSPFKAATLAMDKPELLRLATSF